MNIQVDHSHYNDLEYNEKGRFCSYWHQIDLTLRQKPSRVLEIGTGNGIVKYALQKYGIGVDSIDIDEKLNPDIIGSVLAMPIAANSYDTILCCQVLEHLPYEQFVPALKEIRRVTRKHLILSLPDLARLYKIGIKVPVLGEFKYIYKLPRLKPLHWEFNGEHYWNISCEGYELKKIARDIETAGFRIEGTFNVFEMLWHRFFVLTKS
ncbi:MAG TPA: methyltransferase domain-containing protein [Ohtaekwangia sp.]|nr:methyltransferase domain-containing protein [Ohtaekwangia sp.]